MKTNSIFKRKAKNIGLNLNQSIYNSNANPQKNRRRKHQKSSSRKSLIRGEISDNRNEGNAHEVSWVIEDDLWANEDSNNSNDDDEEVEYLWIPKEVAERPTKRCKKLKLQKLKLTKIEKDVEVRSNIKIISREVFSPYQEDAKNNIPDKDLDNKLSSGNQPKSDDGQIWTNNMTVEVIRSTRETLQNNYQDIQTDYTNLMEKIGIVNKSMLDANSKEIVQNEILLESNCSDSKQMDADFDSIDEDDNDVEMEAIDDDDLAFDNLYQLEENQMSDISSIYEEIDSNECNEVDELSTEETNPPKSKEIIDKNSLSQFYCSFSGDIVLVLLKSPIYLYGAVRLTLLSGHIQLYGYKAQLTEEVEIFAPRGCGMVSIEPIADEEEQNCINPKKEMNFKLFSKKYGMNFIQEDLNAINKLFENNTNTIILLEYNRQRKNLFRQFEKFLVERFFPLRQSLRMNRKLHYAQYKLQAIIHTREKSNVNGNYLRYPETWQSLDIKSNSRIMIVGGKSVGKSTLVRYLCNQNIQKYRRILLIDLDIGQPEIFVPQTISCTLIKQPLIGPGFLLNLQPDKSFVIGHKNIVLCPQYYLQSVYYLIDYCIAEKSKDDEGEIPWIINTMGYNKGFGMELISSILVHLTITDLIQLQCSRSINNYDCHLKIEALRNIPKPGVFGKDYTKIKEYCFHLWPAFDGGLLGLEKITGATSSKINSAKDMRYCMILSRLTMALSGNTEWLTDAVPIKASLKDLSFVNMVDHVCYPSGSDEENNLIRASEGSMVYLCRYNCPTEVERITKPIECFGIGIVRAIDYNINQLYLLPALPLSHIRDVNCIAICEIPLPSVFYMRQGPGVCGVAPYINNALDENATKIVKHFQLQPHSTKRRPAINETDNDDL